jgi:hypothetical protein
MAGRIAAAAYTIDDDEDEISSLGIDEASVERIASLFKIVALSASLSCISTLFNLELLESRAGYIHE